MTTTEAALRDALERWPGYTEQSWPERFAELDRRHAELKTRMYQEITRHCGISKDVSQPSPASSTAGDYVAALAEHIQREKSKGLTGFNLTLGEDGADPQEVARVTLTMLDYASPSSGEPTSVAGEALPSNLAEIIEAEMKAWKGANGGIYAIHACALGVSIALRSALSKPTPVEAGALREALTRLGAPVRIDAFNHIAAGEENYHAMLLSDEDPGCARILAQNMQDQTADDIAFVINAAFNRLQSPSHPVADKRGPYTGSMLSGCMEFSERPQASPPPVQGEVMPYKVETVTGDFMQEPGEPFWRIEIGGYCADFDHEQGAINFAAAINRLAHSQTETQEGE